jgi:hypothetical protein
MTRVLRHSQDTIIINFLKLIRDEIVQPSYTPSLKHNYHLSIHKQILQREQIDKSGSRNFVQIVVRKVSKLEDKNGAQISLSFKFKAQLHLTTHLRNIRNILWLWYNTSRLSRGIKMQQDENPILR